MDVLYRAQLGRPRLSERAAMRLSDAISDCEALSNSSKQLIKRGILSISHLRTLGKTDAAGGALRGQLRQAMDEELIRPTRAYLEAKLNLVQAIATSEQEAGRYGGLTSDAAMAQVSVRLLTAHETAASLLTWALYEFEASPRRRRRLREEIRQHCGDKPPTPEILTNMPYLKNYLFEVLRLHPSAPYLGRAVTETFTLQTERGPLVLPEKTTLVTSLPAQHLNRRLWGEDALVFRPNRFEGLSICPPRGLITHHQHRLSGWRRPNLRP